jgi:DNA-binding transcriptional ArsR family regulator
MSFVLREESHRRGEQIRVIRCFSGDSAVPLSGPATRTLPALRQQQSSSIVNHMVQYSPHMDRAFAAISDPTRRGILGRLGRGDASISDLAARFDMTLTGMKKHVHVLEEAGLVTTAKVGRVRTCTLGPRRLDAETAWMRLYHEMLHARLNRLEKFLERTKGETS